MNGNTIAIGAVVSQAVCDPNFRNGFYVCYGREVQLKAWRQHSDDLRAERPVRHRVSKHGGIQAVAPLEVFVTKDGHDGQAGRWGSRLDSTGRRIRLRYSVRLRKITAERHLGAYQAKEIRCNYC